MIFSGNLFPSGGFIDSIVNQKNINRKKVSGSQTRVEVKTKWLRPRSLRFLLACPEAKKEDDPEIEFNEIFFIRGG